MIRFLTTLFILTNFLLDIDAESMRVIISVAYCGIVELKRSNFGAFWLPPSIWESIFLSINALNFMQPSWKLTSIWWWKFWICAILTAISLHLSWRLKNRTNILRLTLRFWSLMPHHFHYATSFTLCHIISKYGLYSQKFFRPSCTNWYHLQNFFISNTPPFEHFPM